MKRKYLLMMLCLVLVMNIALTACSGHTHTYSEDWNYDETEHWHPASCEHTEKRNKVSKHTFDNGVCTVCGAEDVNHVECNDKGHNYVDGVCTRCGTLDPNAPKPAQEIEWDAYIGSGVSFDPQPMVLPEVPAGKSSQPAIQIHYRRTNSADYNKWCFWLWTKSGSVGSTEPNGWLMNYQDDFGGVALYTFSQLGLSAPDTLGIIPKTMGGWTKDGESDRFWDIAAATLDENNYYHVYITQGDIALYDSVDSIQYGMTANFKTEKQITIKTKTPVTHVKIYEGDTVIAEADTDPTASIRYNLLNGKTPDLEKTYRVEATFVAGDQVVSCNVGISALFNTSLFNNAYNYDGELGALYTQDSTEFRVWSPISSKIVLKLYNAGHGNEAPFNTVEMVKGDKGVFSATVDGDLGGKYYTYTVYNSTYPTGMEIVDPYAKSAGLNGQRGQIVNFAETNPDGWDDISPIPYDRNELVVWETHVADVTSSSTWNGTEAYRKKFLGMIETGTTFTSRGITVSTGFDHIKELGVNAVQLVPIFDQSNDEVNVKFNWGYNPLNYNVLEGAYSTNASDGYARIREFKQLVQAYNQAGINIIMDVVYNHVSAAIGSNFDVLMPGYYYRYTSTGDMSNGSGCGNETKSENPMFRKFMIDSVCFWAKEYKLGGFRFDLMGLHDISTMNELAAALKQINPSIAIYGEPWTGGTTTLPSSQQAVQANANSLVGVGQFNDQMRDALIKGGMSSVTEMGWATSSKTSDVSRIVSGLKGITDRGSTKISDLYKTVNYVTCHDNYTLYDRIIATGQYRIPRDLDAVKKMAVLANSVVLTSNGISFMLAGEEMLRTKGGDHNSYESSYKVNELDYSLKINYADVFENYKALIEFKKGFVSKLGLTSNQAVATNYKVDTLSGGAAIVITITANDATYVVVHANSAVRDVVLDLSGYTKVLATIDTELSSATTIQPYQTIIACK